MIRRSGDFFFLLFSQDGLLKRVDQKGIIGSLLPCISKIYFDIFFYSYLIRHVVCSQRDQEQNNCLQSNYVFKSPNVSRLGAIRCKLITLLIGISRSSIYKNNLDRHSRHIIY
jgi:hypothetical protein